MAERAVSALGLVVLIAIAWALSSDRRRVSWRIVCWGLGLQFGLAILLLKTPVGRPFFDGMNALARALMSFTDVGARFVFGSLADTGFSFFVNVLPIIIVMGSAFAVLYHIGIMQRVVDGLSVLLSRTMRTSGAESLAAVANLFLGMTESALIVKPYLERMTRSELFLLMTMGMATVAVSVTRSRQSSVRTTGVGPAESTGKSRSRYCPGGIRGSLPCRRPTKPLLTTFTPRILHARPAARRPGAAPAP